MSEINSVELMKEKLIDLGLPGDVAANLAEGLEGLHQLFIHMHKG